MAEARHAITVLAVENLSASIVFYTQAFGWRQDVNVPVYAEFSLPGGMRFGLYERESFGRNTGQVPVSTPAGQLAPTELYFYVDDIQACMDRLVRAGARILSAPAPRTWGDEAAYFADPDGNVLVLARPLRDGQV